VLAEFSGCQDSSQRGVEAVVVALSGAAGISLQRLVGGYAVDNGCVVVGIA
jgi:hypothetical protein